MKRFFILACTGLLTAGTLRAQNEQPTAPEQTPEAVAVTTSEQAVTAPEAVAVTTSEQAGAAPEAVAVTTSEQAGAVPEAITVTSRQTEPPALPGKKVRKFHRFQIGLRAGVNAADYKFTRVDIGDAVISPGKVRAGYSAGVVVRLNLTRVLHIQSEFNYDFVNYQFHVSGVGARDVSLRAERFEIPLQAGFQFGPVRLFGGAMFRVAQRQRPGAPYKLTVGFNDNNVAVTGGVGLNIRKFFFDFRVSGYPGANVWNNISYDGTTQRTKVKSTVTYGGSIGFFFLSRPKIS